METFIEILISWSPMVFLLGVWIYFMRKIKQPQNQTVIYMQRQNELMEKYVAVTERMAASLERISEK